jgi:hypothetical protein
MYRVIELRLNLWEEKKPQAVQTASLWNESSQSLSGFESEQLKFE